MGERTSQPCTPLFQSSIEGQGQRVSMTLFSFPHSLSLRNECEGKACEHCHHVDALRRPYQTCVCVCVCACVRLRVRQRDNRRTPCTCVILDDLSIERERLATVFVSSMGIDANRSSGLHLGCSCR